MLNVKRLYSVSRATVMTMAAVAALGITVLGQEAPAVHAGYSRITGLPDDWSHHRVVFSDPGTAYDAMRSGRYNDWFTTVNDPRYVMQQMKRGLPARGPSADDVARFHETRKAAWEAEKHNRRWDWDKDGKQQSQPAINKDWSMILGPSATVGAGQFPAKYTFSTTTAACSDWVAFNTGVTGSTTQASIVAYDNLYVTTCTGQTPSVYWAYNTGGNAQTSVVLSLDGKQVAFVQTPSSGNAQLVLLKWAATPAGRNLTSGTTNITSGSKTFTTTSGLTSMDVGAGISGTGIPASDTIATVTSATAGTLTTAASANGTSGESLAITADAGGPDTLTTQASAAAYNTCTAPCMYTMSFSGTTRLDTISAPYYDYGSDTLYVGDASGGLHKFHPVFNAAPAEVGTPWASPSTTALSGPVYDSTSGNVFVGDASGFVYAVLASSGAVTKSVQVAVSPGIVDAPIVDSTNDQLWVVVSKDLGASVTTSSCGTPNQACTGVIQLPTNFTASTTFTEDVMGVASTSTIYDGAFDNIYWSSANGTGSMYVSTTNGTGEPKLERIPLTTHAFVAGGACQGGATLPANASSIFCANNIDNPFATAAGAPAPVTEILNGSTDYIFTSVPASGNQTGCTGSCIYSWVVTTALAANAAAAHGLTAAGGTSGIIIDNTSSSSGASQVYFSTLGTAGTCASSGTLTTGGCAVQASQAALQ
jgi:hypothetical protein